MEVHVITMDVAPYQSMRNFEETYGSFDGARNFVCGSTVVCHGFSVHVLPHRNTFGYPRMLGLKRKLRQLRPDIVQTTTPVGWATLEAALASRRIGYKLFTGNHHHASVFPLAAKRLAFWRTERLKNTLTRALPGWVAGVFTEKCYAIAPDCAELAAKFFGVPGHKLVISPLGVDTDLFFPTRTSEDRATRESLRNELRFSADDIVCVYSGRFTSDKNPALLAAAIEDLSAMGHPFRGLFIGKGMQEQEIRVRRRCSVLPFMPVSELGKWYRASDIGVWPTQESTSMLDASACGLPVVSNDTAAISARLLGGGAQYRLNDLEDLKRVLVALKDPQLRNEFGARGAERMKMECSWESIALNRMCDYRAAIGSSHEHPIAGHVRSAGMSKLDRTGPAQTE